VIDSVVVFALRSDTLRAIRLLSVARFDLIAQRKQQRRGGPKASLLSEGGDV